ncbi:hypothetical protein AYI68_g3321 [Smittium mucronatum]|uniref:Uncharacterized protein n=1 Tax=Smittium mucronatum TaxID=133383 RepID=A0A1R0H092_9FUNG|nr:hypothetical protein AYI68_g3321 [Smittium mucronatum]
MKKTKSRIEKTIVLTTISSLLDYRLRTYGKRVQSTNRKTPPPFCAKQSVLPVSRYYSSGIDVLLFAVTCLH